MRVFLLCRVAVSVCLVLGAGYAVAKDEAAALPRELERAEASAPRTEPAARTESVASEARGEHNHAMREDVRNSQRRSAALAERLQPLSSTEREELRQLVRQLHVPRTHP